MNESMHSIAMRRMRYAMTPQFDIYYSLRNKLLGDRVLEVGFGFGFGILQYYPNVRYVDAIEIDEDAVKFAEFMLPLPRVQWIKSDVCEYETHKRYDHAVMVETLEHIPDWEKALSNIHRLLKPKGNLIMTARNANADLRRWNELHEREWTAGELHDALSQYFPQVTLYDYAMEEIQDEKTTVTPLVAIAKKNVKRVWKL